MTSTEDELRQKIDTEVIEIDRLHEEIAEYEELRSITTLGMPVCIVFVVSLSYQGSAILIDCILYSSYNYIYTCMYLYQWGIQRKKFGVNVIEGWWSWS